MKNDLISRSALLAEMESLKNDIIGEPFAAGLNAAMGMVAVMPCAGADSLEGVKHFLEKEMSITADRMVDGHNGIYDGVVVGREEANKLLWRHYQFCGRLLALIDKEVKK